MLQFFSLADKAKTEHLLALEGAKERLTLFKADLLEDCSFEQAIEGCDAVFHTASPVKYIVTDPQTELIDPAVKGTLNVLNTCKKSSVKRVIVTSSTAAVLVRQPPLEPNDVVDETFFSDPSVCTELELWYPLSKTLAENAAWQFTKDNGMDMVVIIPGFVIGPLLQPTLNFSDGFIVDMINGKNPFNFTNYRFVDVRDVALAHVKALETPSANGRYLIDGPTSMTTNDVQKTARELFPNLCIAESNGENEMKDIMTKEIIYKVCVEKVKNLGVEFTPVESSLRDTIISLKENCLL
ncbi:Epimerase domain-containing protein [Hirschfeldia incana]|nr:Epimerase domain-containing protein [Hirschfeldia incana]